MGCEILYAARKRQVGASTRSLQKSVVALLNSRYLSIPAESENVSSTAANAISNNAIAQRAAYAEVARIRHHTAGSPASPLSKEKQWHLCCRVIRLARVLLSRLGELLERSEDTSSGIQSQQREALFEMIDYR